MGCCTWPLSVIAWCIGIYSSKKYEHDDDDEPEPDSSYTDTKEDIPVPGFRDLGVMKQRFTRTYHLRTTKPVSYAESEDDGTDAGFD
jgi:hypothetical protein